MRFLFLFFTFFLVSCEYKPYQKSDIFLEKANLETDEALHHKNSLEWWYLTGHLEDINTGKMYGIEYVFFHTTPNGNKDYTLFNVALSDPNEQKFYYDYKFDLWRKRLVSEIPIDLKTKSNSDTKGHFNGSFGNYHLQGSMKNNPIKFDLKTKPNKSVLMHNQIGYENYGEFSRAGYFSYTRLETEGEIEIEGKKIQVAGELWYDRQWNCMGVYSKKVGWDWMAIQLDEPRAELMLYMLHTFEDGKKTIFGGTLYTENEENISLKNSEIAINPIKFWQSPHSEVWYPTAWQINIPKHQIELQVNALIDDQELHIKYGLLSMNYWEGMSEAKGFYHQKQIKGKAYVEMTNRKLHGIPNFEEFSSNKENK